MEKIMLGVQGWALVKNARRLLIRSRGPCFKRILEIKDELKLWLSSEELLFAPIVKCDIYLISEQRRYFNDRFPLKLNTN
jgi:hypothetical protein